MKKSILILTAIVALASCGNETKETKSDSTVVVDSTMVDSSSTDSTIKVDSLSVKK
jgi:hypothetical protein